MFALITLPALFQTGDARRSALRDPARGLRDASTMLFKCLQAIGGHQARGACCWVGLGDFDEMAWDGVFAVEGEKTGVTGMEG